MIGAITFFVSGKVASPYLVFEGANTFEYGPGIGRATVAELRHEADVLLETVAAEGGL